MTKTSDVSRANLLEAAVTAFAKKGFDGTTTRDIAAAAGMSPAALYVHHRSKEQLLYLISKQGHEDALADIRDAMARSEGPVESLRQVVYAFAFRHTHVQAEARIVHYELAALSPEHLTEIRGIRHQIEDEIHGIIASGVEAGVFHTADQRLTTAALLSLGIDLARWYRVGGRWTPDQIAERYATIALRIAGVQEPPT